MPLLFGRLLHPRPAFLNSTTSALLQLTSDIATGVNQREPPHRTVCVAVDLTEAFDTVNHNVLLSKIVRSTLPEATCRWLSNYLRGRQSVTSCRCVQSKAMIVHNGVPQGSKMSPTLFSLYLADMPRPTEPVKRICYADDITVWASGVKLPELEHKINDYLTEMSHFLRDNSLLISAPKSTVTLFTPDPGSKRHSLQAVERSQWFQAAVQIVSNLPAPSNGGPIYRFLGMPAMRTRWMAGAAAHKSG